MGKNCIKFTTEEKFYLFWDIEFTEDMMSYLNDYLNYNKYENWEELSYEDWVEFAKGAKDKKFISKKYPGCHFSATKIVREFLRWYFMCEEPEKLKITGYNYGVFDARFEKEK